MRRKVVAILMGGRSAERDVSLSSGRECSFALKALGYDICEIDAAADDLLESLQKSNADIVFNALHGGFGEDGTVQGVLEWLKIPYTHSGVRASALAMDKVLAKAVFRHAGLRVPDHLVLDKKEMKAGQHPCAYPYVIKPVDGGSSIEVAVVSDLSRTPEWAFEKLSGRVMVEPLIEGRELTVSVLGARALGVTEIITEGWYDYHAKYAQGGSRHILPADIPAPVAEAACKSALLAHEVLGCRGLTRSDFRWQADKGADGLYLLEINTQPGMTPTSLSPEQAAFVGLDFPALCRWIVEDASCNR